MLKRADIALEARRWLRTPFHHQGRVKGVGCDCIGMVVGVIHSLGLHSCKRGENGQYLPFTAFDDTTYAADPNSERLKTTLDEHLKPIALKRARAGDMLLFKVIHLPQHVGIIANHPYGGLSLIHAYSPAGEVVEETLSHSWLSRVVGAYRFPDLCFEGA